MNTKRIFRVLESQPASDGAGVRIRRTVARGTHDLDPFLMLDEIRSDEAADFVAGFPPHPHRGIETLTYMLDGGFVHEDHMGHRAAIADGGAQWMSAGRGVIHSEMPLAGRESIHGFQLWVNLPAADKMKTPDYRQAETAALPETDIPGGRVRVVAGRLGDVASPLDGVACEAVVLDVALQPGASFTWSPAAGHRVLVRPYAGTVSLPNPAGRDLDLAAGQMAILEGSGEVSARAADGGAGMLVMSGRPLGEPIVQYGPFVMNTPEQIRDAIRDYQAGTLAT
ncbi:MAG: pirin family protein [Gammaproteobacteria bacterium]